MLVDIKFEKNEIEKANYCINIDRIIRILDSVYDYAYMKKNIELQKIIEDYLNLKEK